jgi:aminoglycoside phosphotransferase (APT) family kinase protein
VVSVEPPSAPLPGLDLPAVLAWAATAVPGLLSGGTTAGLVPGGRSNLTYVLTDGDTRVILRRPPLGHVLATAHDMSREHRMLAALTPTSVPVPRPLALCDDADVTGAPVYLMTYVEGRVVRTAEDAADLDLEARARVSRAMTDVLADLHGIDPDAAGLAGFGRPEGFMERQVRRWGKQLDASRSRDLPGIEDLRAELAASVPASSGVAVVHGDYRLDNLLVAGPGEPDALRVRAVLDWEMATLGDPLADVGLLLAYWDTLSRVPNQVSRGMGEAAGFPSGTTLAEWYAERRGADLAPLPWYEAFGLFKLAVIIEGIHYRFTLGQTVGEGYERVGDVVPFLVAEGRQRLRAATAR